MEYKVINIKKLGFDCTRRDFEYILYNEFGLDSRYTDNADELEVYIYDDSDKDTLKRALKKYGAEEEYIESLYESKKYLKEKEMNENMKKRFNGVVNESANSDDNRLFVRCFNFVTEENWSDESDAEYEYLFKDGGLQYLMEEVSRESGIEFSSEKNFLEYVIENQAELTQDELVNTLVRGAYIEYPDEIEESVDEGYVYAKIDDVINEAREEGRRQGLNEAKTEKWYEEYDYTKPDGISPRDWAVLGKNAIDWKNGERDENIGACGAEKLRKYHTICKAIKFGKGVRAIESELNKRGLSLDESLDDQTNVFSIELNSLNEGKKPLTKETVKVKKEDLKTAKAEFSEKAKEIKAIVKVKGIADLLKYGDEFDADKLLTACNDWFAEAGKEFKDKKAEVKSLVKELKKLNTTILVLSAAIEEFKSSKTNESVTARFSEGRDDWKSVKLNESEENEDDDKKDGDDSDDKKKGDDGDTKEDDKKKKDGDDKDNSEEEEEEIDIPAIVITIKKEALDKCKEDMIDAGVAEEDIEELENEDEESDTVDLKIDTASILALKDYLKDKGIDLEEKLDITIEEQPEEGDGDKKDEDKDKKKDGENEDELSGLDDDFFASLGEIGGDEGDKKE